MHYYHVFETALGWVAVLASKKGLRRVTLPQGSRVGAMESLGDIRGAVNDPAAFADLEKKLEAYYRGQKVTFAFPLDFSGSTPFRQKVWQAIKEIPYGETRSYGWVAQHAGRPGGTRAAGQATGDNPLSILVPCHRVIAADGSIGGFGGGRAAIDLKRRLLKLENVYPR